MLALYSVYAIHLVASLILSVCSTMHDWPLTESMQMHRGKEDSMFVACLEVNTCCCMKGLGG